MEERGDIFPSRLTTRCQGRLYFLELECKIRDTCRAPEGLPARAATAPYVITVPCGICRNNSTILRLNSFKAMLWTGVLFDQALMCKLRVDFPLCLFKMFCDFLSLLCIPGEAGVFRFTIVDVFFLLVFYGFFSGLYRCSP